MNTPQWQFWIDRGGTFTDIVARHPDGNIVTHKLLSENPQQYKDAALQGIRDLLGLSADDPLPSHAIAAVKMGTTVATNALLERKGEPTLLLMTQGFRDALNIAWQQRPNLFALAIQMPEMLYTQVAEIHERLSAHGDIIQPLDEAQARKVLQQAYDAGLRAVAIVLMHSYRYPEHEQRVAAIAREIGFSQISVSSEVSPLMKLVSRGDTTVVDAYLSPILRRYVNQVASALPDTQLLFMQSSGGLSQADFFQGKDAILSGPAGGVVGMVKTAQAAGFDQLIGFDMGGTSTDVCHFNGEYERSLDNQIAGVRISAPMMHIHTVAAGGGSILHFDGARLRVGPDSAGADPGPAAYGKQGDLTITDCNVMLGKLQPDCFPQIFGEHADQALDKVRVEEKFKHLVEQIYNSTGKKQSTQQVAEGFLNIAVENMAHAIKKISVQRGYDVSDYTLCCFGGAGGQHACLVADALGMERVFLHPFSGVLSAYGMGLADIRELRNQSIEQGLNETLLEPLETDFQQLANETTQALRAQDVLASDIHIEKRLALHYQGSDTRLLVSFGDLTQIQTDFETLHQQYYGFISPEKALVVAYIEVEAIGLAHNESQADPSPQEEARNVGWAEERSPTCPVDNAMLGFLSSAQPTANPLDSEALEPIAYYPVVMQGKSYNTPFYQRESIPVGALLKAPAVILESTGTIIVEPGWQAEKTADQNLILSRYQTREMSYAMGTRVDPVMLEIFNNLLMSVAEQMGFVLEKTAVSVNIKERLDFSCAVFAPDGNLVANAPHVPVHLGSMSESIRCIIRDNSQMNAGDVYMLNAPYNGGTHLPDITVIKPVFAADSNEILFYVAARGHHADIGGITPGSIPPDSQHVDEEGILIDNFKLVKAGEFQEQAVRELLGSGDYPARNIEQNLADLKAQIAACEKGAQELLKTIDQYGLAVVQAYMQHVQDNAEEAVRRVIHRLQEGEFCYAMDDGSQIAVKISVNRQQREALLDFSGTSEQHTGNFNAPTSITRAAVLYVFRCLVDDAIPLNEGCLKPLHIQIPEGSMLNPRYPAAVVAGNVETSQCIVDVLFGALGVMGASQGTMNNFTWGNAEHQYYETICGGSGATENTHGADAVQTHMTNSRLTDPEVLEWRFPVRLEEFSIREHSGGKGEFKGGNGVRRRLRFNETMTANIVSGHRRIAPYGMADGETGQVGVNRLLRKDGSVETLGSCAQVEVYPEDQIEIATPGGGGYGARKLGGCSAG